MADKNIQMTQRNTSNTGWDNLYPITKASNVQVTPISGLAGTDVQTVLQNLFQFANDGKTQIANAITAKGVSASPSETFASLAAKIGQISTGKKWASGTATIVKDYTLNPPYSMNALVLTGLGFQPSLVIVLSTDPNENEGAMYVQGFTDKVYWLFPDSGGMGIYGPDGLVSITSTSVKLATPLSPGRSCKWLAYE